MTRTTQRLPAVAHVETLPCPAGGLHVLVNDRTAHTTCRGCGAEWAALDEEARSSK